MTSAVSTSTISAMIVSDGAGTTMIGKAIS